MPLDVSACRRQFPALETEVNGQRAVFLDGPGGTQVPAAVIDAMGDYLRHSNANLHGAFATSARSDLVVGAALQAAADFFGTRHTDAVYFGPNMTTLTFSLSRALAKTWQAGDEVLVTQLDHDANVAPWTLAAQDVGGVVKTARLDLETGTLDLEHLADQLSERTRLVAVSAASNALGTVNPIPEIVELAHRVGAAVFVDAVHSSSHGVPDVDAWNCDFCACSPYKFFGPHLGMMYGRPEALAALSPYKVRPAPADPPECWMTGTQSHEALAGFVAAVDYLAALGESSASDRRGQLVHTSELIGDYERGLSRQMLLGLTAIDRLNLFGLSDPQRLDDRVPTFAFTLDGIASRDVARQLGQQGIFAWDGNFYALSVTEAYDLEPDGLVRVGAVHYNTAEEITRLIAAVKRIAQR